MSQMKISKDVNLLELVEMLQATHNYLTGEILLLDDIVLKFKNPASGEMRTISISSGVGGIS